MKLTCALSSHRREVYKGFSQRTRVPVAIKIIDLEAAQDEIEDIQQEIAILSQLDSPHVTRYHGSWLKNTKLWIVMEFCGGGSCADLVCILYLSPQSLRAQISGRMLVEVYMRENAD